MSATRHYCAEEICRNAQRLLDRRIKIHLCVEGRYIQISTAEELEFASRVLAVYHSQIAGQGEAFDHYSDAANESLDAVWDALGEEDEPLEAVD
jgi:hypothetical protein